MATISTVVKKAKYTKKLDSNTYQTYHLETDDSQLISTVKIGSKEIGTKYSEILPDIAEKADNVPSLGQLLDEHIALKAEDVAQSDEGNLKKDPHGIKSYVSYVQESLEDEISAIKDLASGRGKAFATTISEFYKTLKSGFSSGDTEHFHVGDQIYFEDQDIADFWVVSFGLEEEDVFGAVDMTSEDTFKNALTATTTDTSTTAGEIFSIEIPVKSTTGSTSKNYLLKIAKFESGLDLSGYYNKNKVDEIIDALRGGKATDTVSGVILSDLTLLSVNTKASSNTDAINTLTKKETTFTDGDVTGTKITNAGGNVKLTLNEVLETNAGTYSAVTVNKKGLVTNASQMIVHASSISDTTTLSALAIGGIAIIEN